MQDAVGDLDCFTRPSRWTPPDAVTLFTIGEGWDLKFQMVEKGTKLVRRQIRFVSVGTGHRWSGLGTCRRWQIAQDSTVREELVAYSLSLEISRSTLLG
jgi:hypothetical protein